MTMPMNLNPRNVVWLLMLLLAGCAWKTDTMTPAGAAAIPGNTWQARVVAMRIYPATRITSVANQAVLEARVEPLDELNDSIKATGRYRLELFEWNAAAANESGQRLYAWDVDVLTLADQQRYYDRITRTYLFRLKLDDRATAGHPTVLRVTLDLANGTRLSTQWVLNR